MLCLQQFTKEKVMGFPLVFGLSMVASIVGVIVHSIWQEVDDSVVRRVMATYLKKFKRLKV